MKKKFNKLTKNNLSNSKTGVPLFEMVESVALIEMATKKYTHV